MPLEMKRIDKKDLPEYIVKELDIKELEVIENLIVNDIVDDFVDNSIKEVIENLIVNDIVDDFVDNSIKEVIDECLLTKHHIIKKIKETVNQFNESVNIKKVKLKFYSKKNRFWNDMFRIYSFMNYNNHISRKELVKQLRLPRTTIYDNLLRLKNIGLVEKYSKRNGKKGRPIIIWKIKKRDFIRDMELENDLKMYLKFRLEMISNGKM